MSEQICHTASNAIPQFRPRKRRKHFIRNPELKELSTKCKNAWRKWCEAGKPREGPLFENKKTLKNQTQKYANKCRANLERQAWSKREELFKKKDPKRFKTPTGQLSLGDKLLINGSITSDPHEIQSCWKVHFSSLATSQAHSNPHVAELNRKIPTLTSMSKLNCDDIIDDEFTVEEIEFALKKLKSGKAGGIDGLLAEHLKYGGPFIVLWLKQIFNAFIHLEHVPTCILTGIIHPIYKGKGKDPLVCHSFRGITVTSVVMKTFEYLLLERIQPILQERGHPSLAQTAYQKHRSCQDAIFATQEAILKTVREGGEPLLCLYDLEKAYDSVEHPVLLNAIYKAGINGKAWRVISHVYSNIHAVVKSRSNSSYSSPFSIARGVQQGSVLSPTFFLVVMGELLQNMREGRVGISIYNLYLGGAAHADDVRTVATSARAAEEQSVQVSKFASHQGLTLNKSKTEVVKFSSNTIPRAKSINQSGGIPDCSHPKSEMFRIHLEQIPLCQACRKR